MRAGNSSVLCNLRQAAAAEPTHAKCVPCLSKVHGCAAMKFLVWIGIAMVIAWAILWLGVKMAIGAIHLLLVLGLVAIAWGVMKGASSNH